MLDHSTKCISDAQLVGVPFKSADIFSREPEAAELVADASFTKCVREQQAYSNALGGPACYSETTAMKNMLRRQVIAHILTNRARDRINSAPAQPTRRHDYNRM
jgi:hypothetical protein